MTILETDRLLVREFRDDDLEELHALFGDEEVMKHTGGSKTLEETAKALRSMMRRSGTVIGLWAVVHKADERLIGRAGFVRHGERGRKEVVYLFAKPYWGQGLATELLHALIAYAFGTFTFDEVVSFGELENPATLRVMEKAGMTSAGETVYDGKPAMMYVARAPGAA